MYQINLLKGSSSSGKHLPVALFAGVAFVIPLALAFAISVGYLNGRSSLRVQKEKLTDYEFRLREFQESRRYLDNVVARTRKMSASLSDVSCVLSGSTQWTELLLAITYGLPENLLVERLDVRQGKITKSIEKKDGAKKKMNIIVPVRTLVLSLYSVSPGGDDAGVREFRKSLLGSAVFKGAVKDVVIAVREPDRIEGKDVVRYELNCILKSDES